MLEAERWLELRRFRALRQAGASISEIARETGLNWRTVKKYLEADGPAAPPASPPRTGRGSQLIAAYAPVIDAWLRAEVLLKGTVIHERLAGEYGFAGNCQRVKMYLQEARPRIAAELGYTPAELARLHRRFEVVPGAQAQVDWGDEGGILAHAGIPEVHLQRPVPSPRPAAQARLRAARHKGADRHAHSARPTLTNPVRPHTSQRRAQRA